MYAFALPFMIGIPLVLGSLWGLVALGALLPLLVARTLGEEVLLLGGSSSRRLRRVRRYRSLSFHSRRLVRLGGGLQRERRRALLADRRPQQRERCTDGGEDDDHGGEADGKRPVCGDEAGGERR